MSFTRKPEGHKIGSKAQAKKRFRIKYGSYSSRKNSYREKRSLPDTRKV